MWAINSASVAVASFFLLRLPAAELSGKDQGDLLAEQRGL
jgi:hypothetical protein